jgi:hypothetical protein
MASLSPRAVAASLLRIARVFDGESRLMSMIPLLYEAIKREGSSLSEDAAARLAPLFPGGSSLRFVPTGESSPSKLKKRARDRASRLVRKVLRENHGLSGADAEHAVKIGHALCTACEQVAALAANDLMDERLRLPGFAGIDGELQLSEQIAPGALLLANAVEQTSPRGVYVVMSVQPSSAGEEFYDVKTLCINRPLPATVADVSTINLGPMNSNFVFHGGWDDEAIYLLHPFSAMPGAKQLTDDGGLAAGANIADIAHLLEDGDATPAEFKVVQGTSTFTYDPQHEDFIELPGAIVASGSAVAGLALAPALFEGSSKHRGHAHEWYEHDKFFHQDTVWKEAMSRLGGECAVVAELHPATVDVVRAALNLQDEGERR